MSKRRNDIRFRNFYFTYRGNGLDREWRVQGGWQDFIKEILYNMPPEVDPANQDFSDLSNQKNYVFQRGHHALTIHIPYITLEEDRELMAIYVDEPEGGVPPSMW